MIKASAYLHGLEYDQNKLDITLKMDMNQSIQLKKFVLIERKTNDEIEITVSNEMILSGSNLIKFQMNIADRVNELTSGIWDAYLHVRSEGQDNILRVKNNLTNSLDYPPLFLNQVNRSLIPYSTVKGNLSFKSDASTATLVTENVQLDVSGTLTVKGYFLVPTWKVDDMNQVNKSVVLTPKNGESKEFQITQVRRPDLSKRYGQNNNEYDWTGFEFKLDFKDPSLCKIQDESLSLSIKMEFQDKGVLLPMTLGATQSFNNTVTYHVDGVVNKILLSTDHHQSVSVLVTREDLQVEIDSVYAKNGEVTLRGQIISSLSAGEFNKNTRILFEKRGTSEHYEMAIKVNRKLFAYTFNINKLHQKGLFTDGIWDLYFISGMNKSRLVSRLDDISNKQKLISLPQQTFTDQNDHVKVIKPYYTLHDEVSILVRDYVQTKTIDKVQIVKSNLLISGKLNVQPPHKELPGVLEGAILIKGQYGARYHLPVEWNLVKTGKTTLEHTFSARMDLTQDEKVNQKKLLRDINFDLLQCQMSLGDAIVPFTMNIDASKVIVTLEDRLKQRSRLKDMINKGLIPFYQLSNRFFPINRKVIVFQSFHGKSYSCNPKAIYEELVASDSDYKAVWVINNLNTEIPGNALKVRPHSIRYYYYMAIGKFFVNNGNFPDFYQKRNGAVHLQTWHGTPLKKLGFDIDPTSDSYAENTSPALLERNKRWDYLIGPNHYTSTILKRAFDYKNATLDIGYPRNDVLVKRDQEDKIDEIKRKLNIDPDKKVMLYAPTWRDYEFHNGASQQPYTFKFDLERMKEKFGDEYVLLVRLHYRDATRIQLKGYEDFVYNVSSYDDIQELYLISNLLITDYSSVMFDYANLKRPMIFFAYDLPRYATQVRGFYFNFQKDAPGPIVVNEDKLFNTIDNIDHIQYKFYDKYKAFTQKFCHLDDGQAARRTIEKVLG